MTERHNSVIAMIGIDIGKNSFHVVGLDGRGAIALRQTWSRGQVETRLADMPPCLMGMAWYGSRKARLWSGPGSARPPSSCPRGRPPTPEDKGELAVYLVLARNMTGQAIDLDGGSTSH